MPDTVTTHVALRDLVLLQELSPRTRLNEETVVRYMESYAALPPIRVQAGTNTVVDGFHRVEAATRLGLERIAVHAEPIADEELRLVAGLSNVRHGQPLTRQERNRLAVALVGTFGRTRDEAAELLGISTAAVTLALREHQFNELLSEKLGAPVQVINSAHVRALYRVGPEQRERLLEVVVSKVDQDGRPYPLTGAELRALVDRMLDPATPTAELNRLFSDPEARPRVASSAAATADATEATPTGESHARPWETEWQSPLKGGDTEAFERVRAVDEQLNTSWGPQSPGDRPVREQTTADDPAYSTFWGQADAPGPENRMLERVHAASRALSELLPRIEPPDVRDQVRAVLALLSSIG